MRLAEASVGEAGHGPTTQGHLHDDAAVHVDRDRRSRPGRAREGAGEAGEGRQGPAARFEDAGTIAFDLLTL